MHTSGELVYMQNDCWRLSYNDGLRYNTRDRAMAAVEAYLQRGLSSDDDIFATEPPCLV